jgi:flagellar FliJ protein
LYRFHLQTVLDNRILKEQNVTEEHASMKRCLAEQSERRRRIESQRAERMLLLKGLQGQDISVRDLESLWGEIGVLFQQQVAIERLITDTERSLEAKRQELLEARKDRKLLETLKDKRLAEFKEAFARKETKTVDEMAIQRYQERRGR